MVVLVRSLAIRLLVAAQLDTMADFAPEVRCIAIALFWRLSYFEHVSFD